MRSDDEAVRGAARTRRKGRRRRRTSHVVLVSLASFVAVVVVAGSLTAYLKYRSVWDGIARVDISSDLNPATRPPADPNAENLLLIGSDTRVGVNGQIGGDEGLGGARSDTIILVHIAPGAHQLDVISIPRDSVVPIYQCAPEGGTQGQTQDNDLSDIEQINATYAYGGPGCLVHTIEQTTGIFINNFVELTFNGFEQMINTLHGVEVCLPQAEQDPDSGLNLTAGLHHVYGPEALAWWRSREDIGNDSDLQRIQRDQYLMASLFTGLEHSSLVSSPTAILSVIDALTSHQDLVTDSGLTPSVMLHLAEALRQVKGGNVQFVTVPSTTYTGNAQWATASEPQISDGNPNWVQWQQPQANSMFTAIAHDTTLPKASKSSGKAPQPAVETVSPAAVQVQVLNGTTTSGLAAATSASLSQRGFDVTGTPGDATGAYTNSVIEYQGAAELPAAKTLAAVVGANVTLQPDPDLTGPTLELILGSSFTQLQPPAGTSSGGTNSGDNSTGGSNSGSSQQQLNQLANNYGGITGSVNICSDSSAFSSG